VENDRILAERLNRILRSIKLEKPDRVPVVLDSYQFSFAQNAQNILHHLCKPRSCKRSQRLNLVSTF
jgi:hypothetical protein